MPSGAKFCKASTRESPTMTTFVTPLAIQQNGLLRYAGTSVCAKNMCKGPPQIATRRPCSIYLSAGNGNAGNGISRNGASRRFSMESNAIQLMACDMDGTFLDKGTRATAANITAVKRLLENTDVLFVPATGKSRPGALNAMGALGHYMNRMYPNGCPGVYLQGLLVFGLDGSVIYENQCNSDLSHLVVGLARELDLDLIAYSRDSVLYENPSFFVDLLPVYMEPDPQRVESWEAVIGMRPLNKFIFMAEPSRIDAIRPLIAERVGDMGSLTQAQGNMLEVLPPLSSKGDGLTALLSHLDIVAENVLAIGDAENDVEMLQMVGYSCAVANALPMVKAVAKYTDFPSNEEDGVASAIGQFFFNEQAVLV